MRSWGPKPLCIFQSASRLHRGTVQRTFQIKRHLLGTSEDAAKTAALSPAPAKEAHPSQFFSRSSRHNLPTEAERAEQPPRDLIKKVFTKASKATRETIAAHEQRHLKPSEISQRGRYSEGKWLIKKVFSEPSEAIRQKIAAHNQRHQNFSRAHVKSLDSTGKPSGSSQIESGGQPRIKNGRQPDQFKTGKYSVSDGQRPEDAKPNLFEKPNLWSRMSSRTARRVQMRSEFDPVVAGEAPKVATEQDKDPPKVRKRKLSLFEELFPEDAGKHDSSEEGLQQEDHDIPKLSLSELVENDALDDEYMKGRKLGIKQSKAASEEAFRAWNPSVLVLQAASPSLIDSDFRRITPKGKHINEWTGPGDYFKGNIPSSTTLTTNPNQPSPVIPARDPRTLKQETHYFLIFPNPAYARAYQKHVMHLHTLAQNYTPISLESPMMPPEGMLIEGKDVHNLIKDYSLAPPSQPLSLIALTPPLSAILRRLLRNKGYPEITQPTDKTGRAVLFWVEGFFPTTEQVQQLILRDGRARGMAWALLDGKYSIQQLDPDGSRPGDGDDDDGGGGGGGSDEAVVAAEQRGIRGGERREPDIRGYVKRTKLRWTIAFESENEARRFVRRWHLRPFADMFRDREHRGDYAPLVHAEYLW